MMRLSATSMRRGRLAQRPAIVEPAAAAVGLQRAGWPIELTLVVEVSGPLVGQLPQRAVLAALNGAALTSRDEWDTAVGSLGPLNTITTVTGDSYDFQGSSMPFRRVDVIEMPRNGLDATIGGPLARTLPGSWLRNLSLGASHGLMVALVSYVHGSGDDLAGGRSVAGTGTIRGDGSVGRIKGLTAKATAARDIGADVLLFPAAQAKELASFDAAAMQTDAGGHARRGDRRTARAIALIVTIRSVAAYSRPALSARAACRCSSGEGRG